MDFATCFGQTRREIVALIDHEDGLNDTVEELLLVGFDRADITVLPSWKTVEKTVRRGLRSVTELIDDPDVPRAVPVDSASYGIFQGVLIASPIYLGSCGAMIAFSAGGAAPGTIAVAGIIAGALGAVLGIFPVICVRRSHRRHVNDMLDRGGLVLWVCISDEKSEAQARTIFARHFARDVRVIAARPDCVAAEVICTSLPRDLFSPWPGGGPATQ